MEINESAFLGKGCPRQLVSSRPLVVILLCVKSKMMMKCFLVYDER